MQAMPDKSIGELKILLPQLKTKVSVDHAGHLLPLLLMKPIKFSSRINLRILCSVNNNLLTALLPSPMETQDAMEDMEFELLNI